MEEANPSAAVGAAEPALGVAPATDPSGEEAWQPEAERQPDGTGGGSSGSGGSGVMPTELQDGGNGRSLSGGSNSFCNGQGTSMYMQGFVSAFSSDRASQPCPVFLFPRWVMNTPGRFAIGCLAAAALGVLTEAVLSFKAVAAKPFQPWLHAASLTLGYTLMLLIMVYSLELAAAVVAGLVGGRVLLDGLVAKEPPLQVDHRNALLGPEVPRRSARDYATTPCCAE